MLRAGSVVGVQATGRVLGSMARASIGWTGTKQTHYRLRPQKPTTKFFTLLYPILEAPLLNSPTLNYQILIFPLFNSKVTQNRRDRKSFHDKAQRDY